MTMTNRLLILALGVALAAGACGATAPRGPADAAAAAPARPVYREVIIPAGTTLPLALTSAMGSDTSAVEDAVTAELARPVMIDGREVLPAGARLAGSVTEVDGSGRVKGRAMIAFRFTSLRTGDEQYDLQAAPLTHVAPATKGEDAAKVGIGAGAGAIIGGILGGAMARPRARSSAAAPARVSCWRRRGGKCALGQAPTSPRNSRRR